MEYKEFAKYYDLFYQKKNYNLETSFIFSLVLKKSKILDIGCGTGIHGSILEEKGYNVDGVDINKEMIEIAKTRISGSLYCQDMLNLNINNKYDVIISMFAVINHLKNKKELIEVFKNMNNILNQDGLIIIDLHNPKASGEKIEEYNGIKRTMKWEYDNLNKTEKSLITFEIGGKVYNDIHKFKIFEITDFIECCEKADLKVYDIFENYDINKKGTKESKNIQFLIGR